MAAEVNGNSTIANVLGSVINYKLIPMADVPARLMYAILRTNSGFRRYSFIEYSTETFDKKGFSTMLVGYSPETGEILTFHEREKGSLKDIEAMLSSDEFYKNHPMQFLFEDEYIKKLKNSSKAIVRELAKVTGLLEKKNKVIIAPEVPHRSYRVLVFNKRREIVAAFVIAKFEGLGEDIISIISLPAAGSRKIPDIVNELAMKLHKEPIEVIVEKIAEELEYTDLEGS